MPRHAIQTVLLTRKATAFSRQAQEGLFGKLNWKVLCLSPRESFRKTHQFAVVTRRSHSRLCLPILRILFSNITQNALLLNCSNHFLSVDKELIISVARNLQQSLLKSSWRRLLGFIELGVSLRSIQMFDREFCLTKSLQGIRNYSISLYSSPI